MGTVANGNASISCQTVKEKAYEQTEHHPELEISEAVKRRLQRTEEAAEICVLS